MSVIRRNFWQAMWFILVAGALAIYSLQFRYEITSTNEKTWVRYDTWRGVAMVCHIPYGIAYAMNFAGDANSVQCQEAKIKEREVGKEWYEKYPLVCTIFNKYYQYCEKEQ
jgi:hypothetical protein